MPILLIMRSACLWALPQFNFLCKMKGSTFALTLFLQCFRLIGTGIIYPHFHDINERIYDINERIYFSDNHFNGEDSVESQENRIESWKRERKKEKTRLKYQEKRKEKAEQSEGVNGDVDQQSTESNEENQAK